MKILIRKITTPIKNPGCETEYETKIIACYPEDGEAITRIPDTEESGGEAVSCSNDNLFTSYEHAEGIYWEDMNLAEVTEMLEKAGHEVITD